MAVAKTETARKAADQQEKKRRRGALLALLLIILAAAAVCFAVFGASRVLFTANPRFQLRKIRVNGPGYWKEHPEELASGIKLKTGTNLFALDLRQLRSRIQSLPNVDSCSIVRILPDTLVFQLVERVPRAFLGSGRSPWVVDGEGVVMPRKQVMAAMPNLPVITGVSLAGARSGKPMKEIRMAVDLIMMTVGNFPDFKIHRISLKNPDKMEIYLQYSRFPIYQVILPVKNRGLSFSLQVLRSAIINARNMGETRTHYDLSYDDRIVIY